MTIILLKLDDPAFLDVPHCGPLPANPDVSCDGQIPNLDKKLEFNLFPSINHFNFEESFRF